MICLQLHMNCVGTGRDGKRWKMTVTRLIDVECLLPNGSKNEYWLHNAPDDPFSPNFVTIKQYKAFEESPVINAIVNESYSVMQMQEQNLCLKMAKDGGWSLLSASM